jgi:signal transduction histidine kinase
MRVIVFSVLLILPGCPAFPQGQIDSLVSALNHTQADSAKIRLYLKIADFYFNADPATSAEYARQGIARCERAGEDKYLAPLYLSLAKTLNATGQDDSAIYMFNQSLTIAEKNQDIATQANALRGIGYIHVHRSAYSEASEVLFKGLKLAETTHDGSLIASLYSTISMLYMHQSNFDKAIDYGEKGLNQYKKTNNHQRLGATYTNVGLIYVEVKNYPKAEEYFENAVREFKIADYKLGLATVYGNIGNIVKGDVSRQIKYLLDAQKIWDEIAPDHPNAIGNVGNLGIAYLTLVEEPGLRRGEHAALSREQLIQKARSYLIKAVALCREVEFGRDLAFFTKNLADLEAMDGNYALSNQYLRDHIKLNDSLYSQETKNEIAEAESRYQLDKKNAELAIKDLTISNQQKQRLIFVIAIGLVTMIGLFVFVQSRARQRHNRRLLYLNKELKEANDAKAKFFSILSHDLRSPIARLVNFLHLQKEEPGMLSQEQVAYHQQKITASAESLLGDMENILLWSKGQLENFKPEMKSVPAGLLFTRLQNSFGSRHDVTLTLQPAEAVTLITDENFAYTILHNLTSNAIKALHDISHPVIAWTCETHAEEVILIISDNGPGLDADVQHNLFEKGTITSASGGFGFHIIRDLANAIRCRISVSSSGQGTSFRLHFPSKIY